jgi:hypothetical protein
MTPLKISILLHYYACGDDFRGGDFSAPAVREAISEFTASDLLAPTPLESDNGPEFTITERGRVYVEALRAVPLPEKRWVVPASHPGYSVPSLYMPSGPRPDPVIGWRIS